MVNMQTGTVKPAQESFVPFPLTTVESQHQSPYGEYIVLENGVVVLVSYMNHMIENADSGATNSTRPILYTEKNGNDKKKKKGKSEDAGKSKAQLVREGKLPIYVLTPSEAAKLGPFKPPR